MKIALAGAFDRNNYGDILMPVVLEKRIKEKIENAEFYYFGLSEANMQYVKGKNTRNICELYENKENKIDVLILVGGEILSSRYTNMYLNLQKNNLKIFILKILSKIFKKHIEIFCKKELNGYEIYPWIIDKDKIGCKKIIYNTVGGKNVDTSESIKNIIKKFDYISVREKETFNAIRKINNKVYLYPDSVISLSEIFNENDLKKEVNSNIKRNIESCHQYYVLQVKNRIGKKIINQIVRQIKEIYNKDGLKCVLLPIGYAQGHEDQKVLKKIYKHLKNEAYFVENNTIYDTAYIIAKSKAYIGTSLHGAITAISYNIPHMALTDKIPKLNDFLKTWDTTPITNTNEKLLREDLKKLLSKKETAEKLEIARKKMLKKADENFNNIEKILHEV